MPELLAEYRLNAVINALKLFVTNTHNTWIVTIDDRRAWYNTYYASVSAQVSNRLSQNPQQSEAQLQLGLLMDYLIVGLPTLKLPNTGHSLVHPSPSLHLSTHSSLPHPTPFPLKFPFPFPFAIAALCLLEWRPWRKAKRRCSGTPGWCGCIFPQKKNLEPDMPAVEFSVHFRAMKLLFMTAVLSPKNRK